MVRGITNDFANLNHNLMIEIGINKLTINKLMTYKKYIRINKLTIARVKFGIIIIFF